MALPPYGPTFRPSYQGWKPYAGVPYLACPNAFRPSYQGWKLRYLEGTAEDRGLLDLPIRDGNFNAPLSWYTPDALLDLPIRDGNTDSLVRHTIAVYF